MENLVTQLVAAGEVTVMPGEPAMPPPPGWVRLKLARAGICGTDMHYFRHFGNAGFPLRNPVTLGHEASAHVVDPNGSDLASGALVALNPIIACHQCDACRRGHENLCTAKRFPGSALTYPHVDGFFRSVIDFPAECCIPVSSPVAAEHLSFAEPLACSLHAATLGEVGEGSRVLVLGCGPMGLLSVIAAASRGATVHCSDLRSEAVERGCEIGASQGFVIGEGEPPADSAYDCVIEASGSIVALNQGFQSVRRQGRIVVLSNLQAGSTAPDLQRIMLKEISLIGSFQFNREFREAVEMIAGGQFDFGKLIARVFALSEIEQAFELAFSGTTVGKIQLADG
nr:L-idonate 5-dehydrogenase [Microbacterium terregens]